MRMLRRRSDPPTFTKMASLPTNIALTDRPTDLPELHEDVEQAHLVGSSQGVQVPHVPVEQVLVPLPLHRGHTDVQLYLGVAENKKGRSGRAGGTGEWGLSLIHI